MSNFISCKNNIDYRLELLFNKNNKSEEMQCQYYNAKDDAIIEVYNKLSKNSEPEKIDITVIQGRKITITGFSDICIVDFEDFFINNNFGASDFIAICKYFSIFILKNLKKIKINDRNLARRFILFIDELYNRKVKLFFNSETDIDNLFDTSKLNANLDLDDSFKDLKIKSETEELFMKQRCISRLYEMRTKKYFNEPHINI